MVYNNRNEKMLVQNEIVFDLIMNMCYNKENQKCSTAEQKEADDERINFNKKAVRYSCLYG